MDNGNIWWNTITGPFAFLKSICEKLDEEKNIIIQVPSDMPYRHEMRKSIAESYKDRFSNFLDIDEIDVKDDCPDIIEVGKYILQEFGTEETKYSYRGKQTIGDYLSCYGVLKNRLIWIKGIPCDKQKNWNDFCQGYKRTGQNNGLFILENCFDTNEIESKNLAIVNYENYIRPNDLEVFILMYLERNHQKYSVNWEKYIASLMASLCNTDVELAVEVVEKTDFRTESVVDTLNNIASQCEYEKRGADAESKHILSLVRKKDEMAIQRKVWEAQVSCLFPLVERFRIDFVKRNDDQLQYYIKNFGLEQFGNPVRDIWDLELGSLIYLMNKRDYYGNYCLYIQDPDERDSVHRVHEMRNKLAHMQICSPEETDYLFSLF